MGLRPGKTKGPWVGTGGGGTTFDADALNTVYAYESIWVDASVMSVPLTNGGTETRLHIPNSNKRRNAIMFENAVTQYAMFYWPEHVTYIAWAAPGFRLRAFGSSDTSGTGAFISLGFSTSNVQVSDDESDNATFPFSAESEWVVDGRGDYDIWQGDTAAGTDGFDIPAPSGRAYVADSNTDINNITVRISRRGADTDDTFTGNFYLYGVAIQWVNDFNNMHRWTT